MPAQPKRPDGPREDIATSRAKWASMKEEWLESCITGKSIHWPTLAAKYGKNAQTARNRASEEKWYLEIDKRRKDREDILETKLTERTTSALDQLNADFATSEVAIRKRHATIARGLQIRAVTRLKEIDLKELTAKDCIALLKLGLDEERYALGMPTQAEQTVADLGSHPSDYKPVTEQLGGFKKVQRIGTALLRALQSTDLSDEEPTDAPIKRDMSDGTLVEKKIAGKTVLVKKKHTTQTPKTAPASTGA